MELDDFKNQLTRELRTATVPDAAKGFQPGNRAMGPWAAYAKNLRFTLYIFPVCALVFALSFWRHPDARQDYALWLLWIILAIEFLFTWRNYGLLRSLLRFEGDIRSGVLQKIRLLKKNTQLFFYIHMALYIMMALVVEVMARSAEKNHFSFLNQLNPFVRIAGYGVVLFLIWMLNRRSQQQHYGKYLDQLQEIAGQLN